MASIAEASSGGASPSPPGGSDLPWPLESIARRPRLAALLGALCIAISGILYRWAEVSPSTATVFRCLFGLPLLALVAIAEQRRFGPLPLATVRLAVVAGIFFGGDLTFWHHAIEAVGAGLATVLGNLQVLIVGIVAWALLGERPSRATLIALPAVLLGVALISGIGGGAYGEDPVLGVVLGIATALCYSGYLLVIRRGVRDIRRPAGPVAIATASTAVTAAVVGLVMGDLDPTPEVASLAWLATLGITSQSAGYLLIALSLPRLPAVLTSIILLAQPVVTVVLSMLLLSEEPSRIQLAGVTLVIGGIFYATFATGRARRGGVREATTPA